MKKDIHPKYYEKSKVKCSCGNKFEIGATVPEIMVEICSNCHHFYTGKEKFIDAAGRLEKFKQRLKRTAEIKKSYDKKRQGRTKKTKRTGRKAK